MSFVSVSNLNRRGIHGSILTDISFDQQRYEKVVIAGETGSGKSTLLRIIAGLDTPDSGEVRVNGAVVDPTQSLVGGHDGVAYLSQQFELAKFLRVEQVLDYANTLSARESKSLYAICRVDHLLKRMTHELSGGEQQRVALARLLGTKPKLLLLDEPYSNLDRVVKGILKEVVADITDRLKTTVILVSHDPLDILSWADKIVVMQASKVIQQGTPAEIYRQPVDDYTAGLFGPFTKLTTTQQRALGIKNHAFHRPEDFKIAKSIKSVKGKVVGCSFLGNQFEVDVQLKDGVIRMTHSRPLKSGEQVLFQYKKPRT